MKLDHQVERKSGYITNRIYTLVTRDKHEIIYAFFKIKSEFILSDYSTNQTMYQGT
jgi:hypothetical protein